MSPAPLVIVSGGQTGVDRAALDVGLSLGLEVSGWCPRGRRAEDGPLDPGYPLRETASRNYAVRTAWNVRDSDATLILSPTPLSGGTLRTLQEARRQGRPILCLELGSAETREFVCWLAVHRPQVLNVAGPRENPGARIYPAASRQLDALLRAARERG